MTVYSEDHRKNMKANRKSSSQIANCFLLASTETDRDKYACIDEYHVQRHRIPLAMCGSQELPITNDFLETSTTCDVKVILAKKNKFR